MLRSSRLSGPTKSRLFFLSIGSVRPARAQTVRGIRLITSPHRMDRPLTRKSSGLTFISSPLAASAFALHGTMDTTPEFIAGIVSAVCNGRMRRENPELRRGVPGDGMESPDCYVATAVRRLGYPTCAMRTNVRTIPAKTARAMRIWRITRRFMVNVAGRS